MADQKEIPFTQELLRKSIHLISLSIPISYIFVDRTIALYILIPLALIAVIIDFLSKINPTVHNFIYKYFGKMLRSHEVEYKYTLNGASWVLISAVICTLIFPKLIMIVSFTILIISDICAAILGRKFGKHSLFNKSWEGTIAFFISALIVVVVYGLLFNLPAIYYIAGVIGAVVGGFAEAASGVIKVDDNLAIPISSGLILLIGELIASSMGLTFVRIF